MSQRLSDVSGIVSQNQMSLSAHHPRLTGFHDQSVARTLGERLGLPAMPRRYEA